MRPAFQITIDTEGDNVWSRPREVTTRNAQFLPRFQALCEKYGFKPTYLTNWEMANCCVFEEFARDVLDRQVAEIGMHLHAWDSPPHFALTSDDGLQHPYLIEYPVHVMRDKIRALTDHLEQTFSVKMESHRAGRWAFNRAYARILADLGYLVDCSVTPHVSWKRVKGDIQGVGGSDYRHFPDRPFWYEFGSSSLLEVPVTILKQTQPLPMRCARVLFGKRPYRAIWLRPNGVNLTHMLSVLEQALLDRRDYVQMILHSSELMPGGSPSFPSSQDVETLYEHLAVLFEVASRGFEGATLSEYARQYRCTSEGHHLAPELPPGGWRVWTVAAFN